MKLFFTNSVPSSNFTYSTTVKPRPSTRLYWYVSISSTQLVFTVIELTILTILQISAQGYHHDSLFPL